jgi:hypothetical protein
MVEHKNFKNFTNAGEELHLLTDCNLYQNKKLNVRTTK